MRRELPDVKISMKKFRIEHVKDLLGKGVWFTIGGLAGILIVSMDRFMVGRYVSLEVVRDFCGHGLGRVFHSAPNVVHFGRWGTGAVLEECMFFTIEPMVNLGKPHTKILADDWTAVTKDKSLSAQFEHSIGVTSTGCEIFTNSLSNKFYPTWS